MAHAGPHGGDKPRRTLGQRHSWFWIGAVSLAVLGLAGGCESYDARSTLQIQLMAKPASGIDAVQLVVEAVAVHVVAQANTSAKPGDSELAGDGHWQQLSVARSVELAKAVNVEGAVALGSLALPEGWIDQLRVSIKAPATATSAAKQCDLVLVKLPKAGVDVTQPFRPFAVYHGLQHSIWLDLRMDLALNKLGDCWSLAPVLQVKRFTTGGKDVSVQ